MRRTRSNEVGPRPAHALPPPTHGVAAGPAGDGTREATRAEQIAAARALESAALRALEEAQTKLLELGETPSPAGPELGLARPLNAREAAAFVGCHTNTIYAAAQSGELHAHGFGRRVRFTRGDLF